VTGVPEVGAMYAAPCASRPVVVRPDPEPAGGGVGGVAPASLAGAAAPAAGVPAGAGAEPEFGVVPMGGPVYVPGIIE
jgi:hypothetical protein